MCSRGVTALPVNKLVAWSGMPIGKTEVYNDGEAPQSSKLLNWPF